jgi:hypothetical protein
MLLIVIHKYLEIICIIGSESARCAVPHLFCIGLAAPAHIRNLGRVVADSVQLTTRNRSSVPLLTADSEGAVQEVGIVRVSVESSGSRVTPR